MNPSDLLEDPVRPDSSDEAWSTSGPAKGLRLRLPVAAAVLVAVALLGVAGGASLEHSSSTTAVAAAAAGSNAAGAVPGTSGAAGATCIGVKVPLIPLTAS